MAEQVTVSRSLDVLCRSTVDREHLPNRARRHLATSLLLIGLLAAGCGWGGDDSSSPRSQASAATAAPATPGAGTTAADTPDAAAAVVTRFIQAANRGDVTALRTLFAADARFDRAGAIFTGRDEIIDRFLKPDVTDAGGRYTETGRRPEGNRLVVAFNFDTGSGGQERFTYSFLVRNGRSPMLSAATRTEGVRHAPGPLGDYTAQFDPLLGRLAQRRGLRAYPQGLLLPRGRNKTMTTLAGAEPVAQHAAVQGLQWSVRQRRMCRRG